MRKPFSLFIASLAALVILVLTGISLWPKGGSMLRIQAPHASPLGQTSVADSTWDVAVLGRIDFCLVCQRGPSPQVHYTKVLAGQLPRGYTDGQLSLTTMDQRLLPEGGVGYTSQREEIVFLKKVVVPGYEDADVYRVVDIKEATPENLVRVGGS